MLKAPLHPVKAALTSYDGLPSHFNGLILLSGPCVSESGWVGQTLRLMNKGFP